jgi:protein-disulfide isomerase
MPLTLFKPLALLILGAWVLATPTVVHAQIQQKVVATVNGRAITQAEVDATAISQLLPLQEQVYALRKAALDNLILSILLEEEAKKRGISVEALREQLTVGKVEILPSQVEEEYLQNISVFGAMSSDEAKARIRLGFEGQARMQLYREALARLKETAKIELRLEEPRLPALSEDDTAPASGATKAAVTIIEFADFQCPFCRDEQSVLKQVLQLYKNDVRLVFKHLPLEIHEQAFSSARAAVCAGEQGFFWQYHDALFAVEKLSPDIFNQLASNLGLNTANFKACLDSDTSRTAVLKDVREAKRLGLHGTPAFIINGRLVRGALSLDGFKDILARELTASRRDARQQ